MTGSRSPRDSLQLRSWSVRIRRTVAIHICKLSAQVLENVRRTDAKHFVGVDQVCPARGWPAFGIVVEREPRSRPATTHVRQDLNATRQSKECGSIHPAVIGRADHARAQTGRQPSGGLCEAEQADPVRCQHDLNVRVRLKRLSEKRHIEVEGIISGWNDEPSRYL